MTAKRPRSKCCPRCRQKVALHPDGSFVMHGQPDGALCSGTNCVSRDTVKVTIGGVDIEAKNFFYDPDGTLE